MTDFGQAAALLAAAGYAVFPVQASGKKPITNNGFQNATLDERQLLHWWSSTPNANIGIACGASGINVVDIDAKHGADPREVIDTLGLEDHCIVWTGEAPERSEQHPDSLSGQRGAQVYFRGTRRTAPRTRIKGVELRGAGAYVVGPPSAHPSGVQYLGELPPAAGLPEMPAGVVEILPPETFGKRKPAAVWLAMLREGVPAGERNNELARIAGHFLRRYIDPDLAAQLLHMINETSCRPPLPAAEVDQMFESICRAELRRRGGSR